MKLNDIEKLYEDGFLSAEQREEAIERYRPGTRGMRRWLAYSLAALAAILITGAISFRTGTDIHVGAAIGGVRFCDRSCPHRYG